jgi:glycopeptide antibiotics resistance protein
MYHIIFEKQTNWQWEYKSYIIKTIFVLYTIIVVHLTFMHTVLEHWDEGGGHRSLSQFYAEHNFIF